MVIIILVIEIPKVKAKITGFKLTIKNVGKSIIEDN